MSTRTARSSVSREHVEQAAPQRELPAFLDLVDVLVAGADELAGALLEVEQLADPERERVGPQRRVRHLLRQGGCADHHDGPLLLAALRAEQRVQRGDAQADEVRGGREMRLVCHTLDG